MNYLGIDYGEKHIGIAVATTFVAEPLEVIPTALAFDRIKELLLEYQIDVIIMGLSENLMAERIRAFAEQLTTRFQLPIIYQDETLSSQDTRRTLAKHGAKRSVRQAKTDHYVAATILQEYLDSHLLQ